MRFFRADVQQQLQLLQLLSQVQELVLQQQPLLPPQLNRSRIMMIIQKQPLLLFPQNILFTLSPRNDFESLPGPRGGRGLRLSQAGR